jgi:hypothetical protein
LKKTLWNKHYIFYKASVLFFKAEPFAENVVSVNYVYFHIMHKNDNTICNAYMKDTALPPFILPINRTALYKVVFKNNSWTDTLIAIAENTSDISFTNIKYYAYEGQATCFLFRVYGNDLRLIRHKIKIDIWIVY